MTFERVGILSIGEMAQQIFSDSTRGGGDGPRFTKTVHNLLISHSGGEREGYR